MERGARLARQPPRVVAWQRTFVPHFDWSVDAPTTAYFLCVKKNVCFSAEVAMLDDVDKRRRQSIRMAERTAGSRVIILVGKN